MERRLIDQAAGREPADLVIKNVKIIDVVEGNGAPLGDIAIDQSSGRIVGVHYRDENPPQTFHGKTEIDAGGELYASPGFIDCHVHVESSMVTPMAFDEAALLRGTTAAFCDPHEMCNVLGEEAIKYFIACSEQTVMDLMVGLSSCVPATPLETSGADLDATTLYKYAHHKNVYGLSEFMNIGGVMARDPDTIEKLARFRVHHIDGHMPIGTTPQMMNVMMSCGIRNCHENTSLEHTRAKLRRGAQIFIREGSVCKDARELAPLVTKFSSAFLGLCTDDRNPLDIEREGHIDHVVRTLIAEGVDMNSVYRMATWSAANHFGMAGQNPKWADRRRGLIAPGYLADIVLLNDAKECRVHAVIKDGKPVTAERFSARASVAPVGHGSVKLPARLDERDFLLKGTSGEVRDVIGLIKDQVVTTHLRETLPARADGMLDADPQNDILHIAVVERHGKNGNIGRGFVKGFGVRDGAMASSVGHDSHNITVVGVDTSDMMIAVQRIASLQGGKVIVRDGKVVGEIALPLAGLMSDQDLQTVVAELREFKVAEGGLRSVFNDPVMTLSFLPLCVIPHLKLTDFGLVRFDPAAGDQAPVLIDDQRPQKPNKSPPLMPA